MVRRSWTAAKTGSRLSRLFKCFDGRFSRPQAASLSPFVFVIFDFADPYLARAMGKRRVFLKVWGLVIICLNNSCQDERGLLLTMATLS